MNNLVKSGDFVHELFGRLTTIKNENGDIFFISNEISNILGYSKNFNMLENIDNEDILKLNYFDAKSALSGVEIHSSGIQLLTESGFYSAVLGSNKPEAKVFKKWVTSEVLPAIRKTGSYTIQEFKLPATYVEALRELIIKEEANQKLLTETIEQKQIIQEQAPKAEFYDAVTDSKDAIDMGSAAKVLNYKGIGRNKLFEILRDHGVLMNNNTPYQSMIDREFFKIIEVKYQKPNGDTCINIKTLVLQKGLDYILKLLKSL